MIDSCGTVHYDRHSIFANIYLDLLKHVFGFKNLTNKILFKM